jgi:hypothetical protein
MRRYSATITAAIACFAVLKLHAAAQTISTDKSVMSDTPPAGAPTAACTVTPVLDASKLLIVTGDTPVPYVFACGENRPAGKCAVVIAKPGSADLPGTTRFMSAGEQRNGWTCVEPNDSTSGWIPSNRLAPLPPTPAITTADWLGSWRQGKDSPGIKNDRLIITRSKTPKTLHVSGSAYWYGLKDNVHTGGVNADASAYGDTMHIVEGTDTYSCVVDLVYQPATHTFTASDNSNCGGMNVRFLGEWQRFTPKAR